LLKEHGWPEALRKEEYLKALEEERSDAAHNEHKQREDKERRRKTRHEIAVGKTYDLRSKSGRGGSTAN
jgi:aromatic ring hydroxylase